MKPIFFGNIFDISFFYGYNFFVAKQSIFEDQLEMQTV